MKFIRATFLFAASAAFLAAQTPSPGGAVEGTVVDSVTGAGIGGASVTLVGRPSARYQATADAVGHFKITGITPGNYRAAVEKDGFASPPDLRLLESAVWRVDPGDLVKLEFKLTPFHTISGRVLGADGEPASGVEVSLSPNIMAEDGVTDAEGHFELGSVRPGSYTLVAKSPKGAKPEEAKDGTRTAMVTTYYPSTAEQSLAEKIVFPSQGFSGEYEIRMQTAIVHRVRGIVLDEAGKPSPGAELSMLPLPEGSPVPMGMSAWPGRTTFALGLRRELLGPPEITAVAGADGRFEFPAVRSGDWRIGAEPSSGPAGGTADISIGRADVDDVQVHLAVPFRLMAAIEWKTVNGSQAATNPLPLLGIATLIQPDTNEFVQVGIAESSGVMFENILPGRYKILVKPGLSAQVFLGEYEVTGQAFMAAADGPPLRIVLKTSAGTVRGTVEKGDGATVVLVPQRVESVALGQTVACGAGGSFEMTDVSPGDYYVAAFDHLDGLAPSEAMLDLARTRGTNVKVEERSAADVMLSVIASPR